MLLTKGGTNGSFSLTQTNEYMDGAGYFNHSLVTKYRGGQVERTTTTATPKHVWSIPPPPPLKSGGGGGVVEETFQLKNPAWHHPTTTSSYSSSQFVPTTTNLPPIISERAIRHPPILAIVLVGAVSCLIILVGVCASLFQWDKFQLEQRKRRQRLRREAAQQGPPMYMVDSTQDDDDDDNSSDDQDDADPSTFVSRGGGGGGGGIMMTEFIQNFPKNELEIQHDDDPPPSYEGLFSPPPLSENFQNPGGGSST